MRVQRTLCIFDFRCDASRELFKSLILMLTTHHDLLSLVTPLVASSGILARDGPEG